jgi:UDP-N-acetylglucosamine 2-epimerase (non-hydrolysing)
MNRKLLGSLAAWHFAPTREAVKQLRAEGVPTNRIFLTGNTVVDSLRSIIGVRTPTSAPSKHRLVLVTCHRRENFGRPMQAIAQALATIAHKYPELKILFPVHPNPAVRATIRPFLKSLPNVVLCSPMNYDTFIASLNDAWLVLSDSGGVQEEATALGKPVLVLREQTERPEGVQAGALKLVGASTDRIVEEFQRLYTDPRAYARMARASNVFGDGHAAERIVKVLEKHIE